MKKNLTLVLLLIVLHAQAQQWQMHTSLPGFARDDAAGFTLSNMMFVGTGTTDWFAPLADFYSYNAVLDQWVQIASLPTGKARQYACGFSNSQAGVGFVFGGIGDSGYFNDVWQYNPNNALGWVAKSPLPGLGRAGCSCFAIGDTAYVIGGKTDSSAAIAEVWAYSMSNDTWQRKSDLPFGGLWRAAATSLANRGYITLGKNNAGSYPTALYAYSPLNDSWVLQSNFPLAGRTHAQLTAIPNGLFLAFGSDSIGGFYKDVWRYTIHDGQWTNMTDLPGSPRRGGVAFTIADHSLFYVSGLDSTLQRTGQLYQYTLPQTGINENVLAGFSLAPNPATHVVKVVLPQSKPKSGVAIFVFSAQGAEVFRADFIGQIEIEIADWPSGLYIVQLVFGGETGHQKLVKP